MAVGGSHTVGVKTDGTVVAVGNNDYCQCNLFNWHLIVSEPCGCDLNQDGSCNGQDWLLFYPHWGRTNCNDPGVDPCACDLNSDGSCNGSDWLLFYPDWGRTDCAIP